MPIIFITHTHADNEFVKKLTMRLEEYGYTIWVDLKNITPGSSIPGKISEAFNEIDYQLIVISNESMSSKWVKKEIDIGVNYEINHQKPHIIGLKIDNAKIPVMLSEKLYVKFKNFEDGWRELNRKLPDISSKIPKNTNKEIYEFLDYCRYVRNVQLSTLDVYEYNLMRLGNYFEDKGLGKLGIDFDWKKVKEKHLKGYDNYLSSQTKLSSSSIHQQISTLRNFFGFLKSEEIINENPMEKIPLPKRINIDKELIDYNEFNEV